MNPKWSLALLLQQTAQNRKPSRNCHSTKDANTSLQISQGLWG